MADDPKTLVHRFYSDVTDGRLEVIEEMITDDFVDHEDFPGIPPTKEGVRQFFEMFRSSFPDMRMEPHEIVADGDLCCVRATMSGTQQGDFMGVPPTGRHIEVEGFDMVRFRGDQVCEHWGLLDAMTMMQQLGAMAAEETPA